MLKLEDYGRCNLTLKISRRYRRINRGDLVGFTAISFSICNFVRYLLFDFIPFLIGFFFLASYGVSSGDILTLKLQINTIN